MNLSNASFVRPRGGVQFNSVHGFKQDRHFTPYNEAKFALLCRYFVNDHQRAARFGRDSSTPRVLSRRTHHRSRDLTIPLLWWALVHGVLTDAVPHPIFKVYLSESAMTLRFTTLDEKAFS